MANLSSTKGKVVLVPFPFDDLSASKVRPAVCLSNPVGPHAHVVVAFITSQTPPHTLSTDLDLDPTEPDFAQPPVPGRAVHRNVQFIIIAVHLRCAGDGNPV
jgi:mRNA-degrading endonuclease toxin of MazEF toxin-antitoxin module